MIAATEQFKNINNCRMVEKTLKRLWK